MKRIIVFLAGLLSIVFGYSQTKTTYYYDTNWKGVEDSSFATYYRSAMVSRDKKYANKFRDYECSSNVLIREGSYISIDKYDDSKSVFTGIITSYYDNGAVKSSVNYVNGILEGEMETYYEDGQLMSKEYFIGGKRNMVSSFFHSNGIPQATIEYKDDLISGKYETFDEQARSLFSGTIIDNTFTGTIASYNDNGSSAVLQYVNDILNGPAKYYENGQLFAALNYSNGLLDGRCIWYDGMGHAIKEVEYKDGIKSGRYEYRGDGSNMEIRNYKIVCSADDFGVSIATCPRVYDVSSSFLLYNDGGKMPWNLAYRKARQYFTCEFPIEIMNVGKADVPCVIDNVVVESHRKDKVENILISEATTMQLFTAEAEEQKRAVDMTAMSNAQSAATVSSESSTISKSRGGAVGGASAGIGRAIGDNSLKTRGYNLATSRTKENSNTSYLDGLTQYQIYQEEKVKSDAYKDQVNLSLAEKAEQNNYSSFTAVSGILTQKVIVAGWPYNNFDSITLSFTLNGESYSFSWSKDELNNSLIHY